MKKHKFSSGISSRVLSESLSADRLAHRPRENWDFVRTIESIKYRTSFLQLDRSHKAPILSWSVSQSIGRGRFRKYWSDFPCFLGEKEEEGSQYQITSCLEEEKEEKDSARAAPSATAKCCVTTSRASPSPPSAVLHAVVVSSASQASSTKRPVVYSKCSSRT